MTKIWVRFKADVFLPFSTANRGLKVMVSADRGSAPQHEVDFSKALPKFLDDLDNWEVQVPMEALCAFLSDIQGKAFVDIA